MTSTTRRLAACSREEVFDVLADGWLYAAWVVGASRVRAVDDGWPAPGTHIHHSVGTWPLVLDDSTQVLACHPPHHLSLRARGWPVGAAQVDLDLRATGSGSEITLRERPVSGPGRLVPTPVLDAGLRLRNVESLRRLALVAEGRAAR